MAAVAGTSMKLRIVHGSENYDLSLSLPPSQAGDLLCVQHLMDELFKRTGIPASAQRLIHKGKSLKDPAQNLVNAGLKDGSKVMFIGKKPTPQDDSQVQMLKTLEKSFEKEEQKLNDITYELDGVHRGFIPEDTKLPAIKQFEKRLITATENLMKLLEKLDALAFDESNKEARAKRKTLVDKIHVLIDRCEGLQHGTAEIKDKFAKS
ncbi:hypothetical protein CHS0354_031203 [Potamilus streckersoni]|uniref:BAG family molecular chaperone regulator 1 n=1 Tax=Potamilus streckersoni TaxID=2493646 RepID=A0AAE0TLL9_9BIVA|nr:hypothetical protein CHS0354_031203 [Potamilus streckersoni]